MKSNEKTVGKRAIYRNVPPWDSPKSCGSRIGDARGKKGLKKLPR